jgi:hypothetical protein
MTPRSDFIHDPRDYAKSTYGTMKDFESFSGLIVLLLFVALLSLATIHGPGVGFSNYLL